jgi:hypothetical protein
MAQKKFSRVAKSAATEISMKEDGINEDPKRGKSFGGPWMNKLESRFFEDEKQDWHCKNQVLPKKYWAFMNFIEANEQIPSNRGALVFLIQEYAKERGLEDRLK